MNATSQEHGTDAAPHAGRVSQLVGREMESIGVIHDSFKEAWTQRDLPRSAIAFAWLREALTRHMRWEEESLFEELEQRCSVPDLRRVRAHHFRHEALEGLLERIGRLLEKCVEAREEVGADLGPALCELDTLLREHQEIELVQVCFPLDQALQEPMLREIETELYERGRI